MKTIITMAIMLSIGTPYSVYADDHRTQLQEQIDFGQKIFRKKLQKRCGYTASYWAKQYTLTEWKMFKQNGEFKEALITMCPKTKEVLKDKWIEPLYLFASEYAKDSDKRPKC